MANVSTVRAGSVSVKIYTVRRPGTATRAAREIHTVSWVEAGGMRRKQFADAKDARSHARTVAERLAVGRVGAAEVSVADLDTLKAARALVGNTPIVAALEEWAEARRLAGADVLNACRAWSRKHSGGLPPCTVAEAQALYLKAREKAGAKTKAGAGRTLPRFTKDYGARQIASIPPEAISSWLDQFAHPVSRNSHRKRIVAFFRWCRDRATPPLLAQDTRTAPEIVERVREPNTVPGVVTPEQLRRAFDLVKSKAPDYLPVLALAAYCGLRRAEVHGQDWKDIVIEREFVRVTAAKPGTPARRLVPLPSAAVPWLVAARKAEGPLCENLALDRIRDICRTAGLDLADNGFRHTYISARVAITGEMARVALESGTSERVIHRHYRELLAPDEAAAWFEPIAATAVAAEPQERGA